jgi:hypothetical protein
MRGCMASSFSTMLLWPTQLMRSPLLMTPIRLPGGYDAAFIGAQ